MVSIDLLEQSCCNFGIDKNIEDLRVIIWGEGPNGLLNLTNLSIQDFLLESWTTDTISVHHDQAWLSALVSISVCLEWLPHEVFENFCPILSDQVLLLTLCKVVLSSRFASISIKVLVDYLCVMLGKEFGVGSGKTNHWQATLVDNIDTNNHWVELTNLVANLDAIEVELSFGVHLTKNVCVNTKYWSLAGQFFVQKEFGDELRDNSVSVEELLYLSFGILFLNKDYGLSTSLYIGYVWLNYFDVRFSLSSIRFVWDLDIKDFSILVIRINDKLHTQGALSLRYLDQEFCDIWSIIFMIDHCPLLLSKFQWLGRLDLSILKGLEVDKSVSVFNFWRLQFLTVNFGHLAVHFNSPLL